MGGLLSVRKRVRRWWGIVTLGWARLLSRLRSGDRARVVLSLVGVALAVSFMLLVTGVSLGLATQSTVYGDDVDYWVTPESASSSTMAVSVGGPQFGEVHSVADRMNSIEGVDYASPVALELARLNHANSSEYVLLIGVIAHQKLTIAGLNAGVLTPGDPLYANGTYNGTRTGEIALSSAAATLLNTSTGSTVTVRSAAGNSTPTFAVVNVSQGAVETGAGSAPIGLVHLAELQTITSGTNSDTADQFLVSTDNPAVKGQLADIYPHSTVVAGSGASVNTLSQSKLALALALTAFLVAIIVGSLFVGTALGLDIAADRPQFATLSAVGIAQSTQSLLVISQTIFVAIIGGLLGVVGGFGGIALANNLAYQYIGQHVAVAEPVLAVYGLVVALLIGLLSTPYLVWLTNRTPVLEQLTT